MAQTTGVNAALDAALTGKEEMQLVIRTSGTGWKGHTGRIETGQMLESVEAEATLLGGRFGWLKKLEDYFHYQNEGFYNVGKGAFTEGMHAYESALLKARIRFQTLLSGVARKAWRSL